MELSTIARHGFNPIVVVLNNHGYTTERFLLEGPFNDIQDWAYHKVPDGRRGGIGAAKCEPSASSMRRSRPRWHNTTSFSLLNVHLDPYDRSPAAGTAGPASSRRSSSRHDSNPAAGARPPWSVSNARDGAHSHNRLVEQEFRTRLFMTRRSLPQLVLSMEQVVVESLPLQLRRHDPAHDADLVPGDGSRYRSSGRGTGCGRRRGC